MKKKTIEHYTTRNGIKLALPIYYRNKIYTDEQREKLWINLLDKHIRYINGIKPPAIEALPAEGLHWRVPAIIAAGNLTTVLTINGRLKPIAEGIQLPQ